MLNVSHLGVVSGLLEGMAEDVRGDVLRCIGERNLHELRRVYAASGVDTDTAAKIEAVLQCYGTPAQALPRLRAAIGNHPALDQLEALMRCFDGSDAADKLRIDFSVMSDMNYYNGVVFKGFVPGAPESVLSGGQYDRLMRKMNRKSGAIGFAVYMDQLERLQQGGDPYDVDVLLIYDDAADIPGLQAAIAALNAQGLRVSAQRSDGGQLRCRRRARYQDGEVKFLEEYA